MQLSVLFGAPVSFVILAAASPAPGAISKRSSKRENLDINFQRDLLEESKKREELETEIMSYIGYAGEGPGGPSEAKTRELQSGLDDYDQLDKKRELLVATLSSTSWLASGTSA
ncbi:hypothetical protein EV702DRAFT_1117930 [Suillus placidus]|uniref:Uncharacterized protein n=1 Tax=Suillus placidus TaxID=48579 RepID=A0A9P6ZT13_9AGAM|nr:hypothetical protein EV702DRAFT_1117930 [Suillus placidus]